MENTQPTTRAHSKFGASAASRWTVCTASVSLIEQCPPLPTSQYAAEGTAAHALAETVLRNKPGPNAFWYIKREHEVKDFPKDFKITEEMAEHVQSYVDYVRNHVNELKGELLIEHRFHLKHIHPDFFGTCDAVVLQPFGELHVFDFKYGAGIAVEVEDNKQMQFYALGALELGDFTKVVLHVCQPRADHKDGGFRKWETTPEALVEFGKFLRAKAIEAASEKAKFEPGDHCKWCAGAAVCPAIAKRAIATAQSDFTRMEPTLPEPKMLTTDQVAKVIQYRKMIEAWFDSVEEYAFNALMRGEKIEGTKLVSGRSSREWIDDQVAEETLCRILGERAYQKKLLSVSQAEKVAGKDSIVGLFQVVSGRPTIAPLSDRRKELASAKDAFEKIETISADDF